MIQTVSQESQQTPNTNPRNMKQMTSTCILTKSHKRKSSKKPEEKDTLQRNINKDGGHFSLEMTEARRQVSTVSTTADCCGRCCPKTCVSLLFFLFCPVMEDNTGVRDQGASLTRFPRAMLEVVAGDHAQASSLWLHSIEPSVMDSVLIPPGFWH